MSKIGIDVNSTPFLLYTDAPVLPFRHYYPGGEVTEDFIDSNVQARLIDQSPLQHSPDCLLSWWLENSFSSMCSSRFYPYISLREMATSKMRRPVIRRRPQTDVCSFDFTTR
jgi:hypothetical protein